MTQPCTDRYDIHPRISVRHPEISEDDVRAAIRSSIAARRREDSFPSVWVGIGFDNRGRKLEYIMVNVDIGHWLVFHAMLATTKVERELGL